jgi:phosphate transport system protein
MEHPVARDFREVTAALKMITDLERIGDQAWDIAEITTQFGDEEYVKKLEHVPKMAVIVTEMVKDGVQAYISKDLELARSLDITDDEVDGLFNTVMADLIALIKENPDNAEQAIMLMMITKYLERIGDHAVNIGEWVEYAITGNHPKKLHI